MNEGVNINCYKEGIGGGSKDLGGVESGGDKKVFDCMGSSIVICGKGVVENRDKIWVEISYSGKGDGVYGEGSRERLEILGGNGNGGGVLSGEMLNKVKCGVNGDIRKGLNEGKGYSDGGKSGLEKLMEDCEKVMKKRLDGDIGNKSNGENVRKGEIGLGNVEKLGGGDMGVCSGEGGCIGDGKGGGRKGERDLSRDGKRKDNGENVSRGELGLGSREKVVFGKSSGGCGLWKE